MANTVIAIRASGTAAATPSLGVIANGEIALNYADGIIYYKTSSNTLGSIRTTQPAGLTTEVQYNDAGSFGANSNFTFNKTIATLNVKNINVSTNLTTVNLTATSLTTTTLTTGSGAGGTIAGANVIYSNTFVANTGGITTTGNSSLNGIVTINYNVGATSSQNVAIEMYGANTKGGTGYFDFLAANNISGGATNRNKWFRTDTTGQFQIINSAYTSSIFNLDDSGNVTVPGYLRTSGGYIQFADGTKQYTANAGSGSLSNTQILAGLQTVSATNNITFDYVAAANNGQGFNFKVGDDVWIGDINTADTMSVRGQQNAANGYIVFGNADSTSKLGRAGSGPLTYGANTVWHAGNDGTGSGLDADLLDGLDSASFANAAFANTVTAFARGGTNATSYTTGTFLTSNGTAIVSVANTGTAGTYGNAAYHPVITTDAYGRVSAVTNTAIVIDTSAITSGTLADARLPTKGTAGTYGNTTYIPVITTDAYGRVTGVTNTTIQSSTTSVQGIVQLNDTTTSTSTTTAATPNSVNTVYNYAATKFNTTGGSITGDVSVTGNLTISGNLTSFSANNIVIDDTIIYIANNNSANVSDIGFVGHYTDSKYQHTGLVRDASDGRWKLFSNVTVEPTTTLDFTLANYDILQIGRLETTTANITSTNTSTSTSTGALTISGGLGVAGNVYAGAVYSGGTVLGADTLQNITTRGSTTANAISITNTTISTSNTTGALTVSGGLGVNGNVYASNVFTTGDLVAGIADGNVLAGATNPIIAAIGNTNSYVQNYVINYSNTANASADWAAYPNNGTDASGWIDMGITSNTYAQAGYNTTGRNEGYLLMSAPSGSGTSGNLVIATDSTGTYNSIEHYPGGFNSNKGNSVLTITIQTSSTSNTTGGVVIRNGLGVRGNVYADTVYSGGSQVASIGDAMAMAIALG